ncbi:MAG TPA: hypothetical protein VFV44_03915 [Nitrospiraceae bacterium]|nr:hypothetical protein [Nitrospiraceae bacterium]
MAEVTRCEWISPGPMSKLVRHVAFGCTLAVNGERGRKVFSAWTSQEDALMPWPDGSSKFEPDRPEALLM